MPDVERRFHTIEVMAGLLRGLRDEVDEARVWRLAEVAADAYLAHADHVSPEDRMALLSSVIDNVAREL